MLEKNEKIELKMKSVMLQKKMTVPQLAKASGVNKRTIEMWFQNQRIPNDVYKLMDIARALGCELEDIIEPPENIELIKSKLKEEKNK